MADGGDAYNSGWEVGGCRFEKDGFEEVEEEEMGKVICAELGFEAINGFAVGSCHDLIFSRQFSSFETYMFVRRVLLLSGKEKTP